MYNQNKPKKHDIKTFGLCNFTTGFSYNLLFCFGKDKSFFYKKVASMRKYLNIFYTHLILYIKHLQKDITKYKRYYKIPFFKNIYFIGVLMTNHKNFPIQIKMNQIKMTETMYFVVH